MKNVILNIDFAAALLINLPIGSEIREELAKAIEYAQNPKIDILDFAGKLNRPIAVFDAETTGTNASTDRIVSLSYTIIHPDGDLAKADYLINPGIPIPEGASAIHKIYDDDVRHLPSFKDEHLFIFDDLSNCDLLTFNGNRFDIPLLSEEFSRCGLAWPDPDQKRIDASQLYRIKNKRSLEDAFFQYIGIPMDGAHDAQNDVSATLELMLALLKQHDDLAAMNLDELHVASMENPNQVDFAGKLALDENGDYIFTFGKNKGKKVLDDVGYAAWMRDADFPAETKKQLERILDKGKAFAQPEEIPDDLPF